MEKNSRVTVRRRKSNAHELLGKLADAMKSYEEAVKLDPNDEDYKAALAKLNGALK